jgi:ribonuclease HII
MDLAHEVVVVELSAEDINGYHRQGLTLNEMEVTAFTYALNDLQTIPDEIYLDAADVLEHRFRDNILRGYPHDVPMVSEHKADLNRPVVAAASIVAKVTRDAIMAEIAPVSGYGDKNTMAWIKEYYLENGEFPAESRYFWKTFDTIKSQLRVRG